MPTNPEFLRKLAAVEEKIGEFSRFELLTIAGGQVSGRRVARTKKLAAVFLGKYGKISEASYRQDMPEWEGEHTLSQEYVSQQQAARIYLNTDVFSRDAYNQAVAQVATSDKPDVISVRHLTTAVCIATSVKLLVSHKLVDGKAFSQMLDLETTPPDQLTTLLLLSAPAIDLDHRVSGFLQNDHEQLKTLITAMYDNIFSAASQSGSRYIALPAAGLGAFLDPVYNNDLNNKDRLAAPYLKLYWDALFAAAKKFPTLNVIYHAGQWQKEFKAHVDTYDLPSNVAQATKDLMFVADGLIKSGESCALHNPSDFEAVLGVRGLGMYWATATTNYAAEEHLGATTTLPLHGRGLNPDLYSNPNRVIEFTGQIVPALSPVGASVTMSVGAFNPLFRCASSLDTLINTYRVEKPSSLKINKLNLLVMARERTFFHLPDYIECHPQRFLEVLQGFFSHRTKDELKKHFGEATMAIAELYAKERVELAKNRNDATKQTKQLFLHNVLMKLKEITLEPGNIPTADNVKKAIKVAYFDFTPDDRAQIFKATFSSRIERLVASLIGKDELNKLKDPEPDQTSELGMGMGGLF